MRFWSCPTWAALVTFQKHSAGMHENNFVGVRKDSHGVYSNATSELGRWLVTFGESSISRENTYVQLNLKTYCVFEAGREIKFTEDVMSHPTI